MRRTPPIGATWRRYVVTRCAWAGAAFRPATGNLVLLADTSLVGEPDFYRVAIERLCARDFFQARCEAYGMARPSLPA